MTREEAIEILIAVAVCDRPILSCDFCARYVGMGTDCTYPSDKEIEESVLLLKGASNDAAISSLRQQEHFREVTKKTGPLTNAQKIRAMTDEELVNFLMRLMGHAQCFAEGIFPYHPCPQEQNCKQCGIDWLQQPAEEDGHDA